MMRIKAASKYFLAAVIGLVIGMICSYIFLKKRVLHTHLQYETVNTVLYKQLLDKKKYSELEKLLDFRIASNIDVLKSKSYSSLDGLTVITSTKPHICSVSFLKEYNNTTLQKYLKEVCEKK